MRHPLPLAGGLLALALAGCGPKPTPSPVLLSPEEEQKLAAAETVDNPQYKQWAPFPVGTTLTRRMTTDSAKSEGMTVTTFVFKITEKTADAVVVESEATTEYHGGRVDKNPSVTNRYPRRVALPDGIQKEDWGKPNEKAEEEAVTVLGKTYKARKTTSKGSTDAGQLTQEVWSSDDMPGGLVKSVSTVPKVEETTTIEVVALSIPK
jgi:hypothetical protein